MSSAKYQSKDYKKKEKRSNKDGEVLFQGHDEITNTLDNTHTEAQAVKETLEGAGLDPEKAAPEMQKNTPYGEKSYMVKHEAVKTNNFDTKKAQEHLDDPKGEYDIEFDEEGDIYNVRLLEAVQHHDAENSQKGIIGKRSNEMEKLENDLMGIHAIIYEDPSGEDYLLHWDPGRFTPEGEKRKYLPDGDKPSLEHRNKDEDVEFYEDNNTYRLEEGLEVIRDTLNDMKERLYSEASELAETEDYSSAADEAWEAERWRAITESVDAFRMSRNQQKPVDKKLITGR